MALLGARRQPVSFAQLVSLCRTRGATVQGCRRRSGKSASRHSLCTLRGSSVLPGVRAANGACVGQALQVPELDLGSCWCCPCLIASIQARFRSFRPASEPLDADVDTEPQRELLHRAGERALATGPDLPEDSLSSDVGAYQVARYSLGIRLDLQTHRRIPDLAQEGGVQVRPLHKFHVFTEQQTRVRQAALEGSLAFGRQAVEELPPAYLWVTSQHRFVTVRD